MGAMIIIFGIAALSVGAMVLIYFFNIRDRERLYLFVEQLSMLAERGLPIQAGFRPLLGTWGLSLAALP